MKLDWLNDALRIQAETPEEKHALAIVLRGLKEQSASESDGDNRVSESEEASVHQAA